MAPEDAALAETEAGTAGSAAGSQAQSGDRAQETRERLILAAERLFAEEGMGVSLRRINAAAGQKNVSALHYHFGDRDALVEAILAYRMARSSVRRDALLAKAIAEGRAGDLRALVEAAIRPVAEQIRSTAAGSHFVRFVAQTNRLPELDGWGVVPHRSRHSLTRVYLRILRLVTDLPRPIVHARTIMALRRAIYVLADLDRVIERRHPDMRDAMVDFYAEDLIDMLTAELRAPLSETTRRSYEALIRRGGGERAAFFGPDTMQAAGRRLRARPSDAE
ncbi:MAG: TetR family transcriptional regulator [Pseudomonadota bacterium]|nr:TetR family transcriptional regulator [Pseudomonadota bacterium]